ncbi:hypothetical protein OG338_10035 [Streptomyces sp. NBC_00726]
MESWREGAHAGHTHEPHEVTVQLDGLGRQLSELVPEPVPPEGADGPVFVDESGRRGKTMRRLGWVLGAVFICYALTLVVAVLGGSSAAPFLPVSGQEEHQKTEEVRTSPSPSASPGEPSASADASPGASLSATPPQESGAALPGGTDGGRPTASATRSPASGSGTGSKPATSTTGGDGGGTPADETTPASGQPTDTGSPDADPDPPAPETTPPTTESAGPPPQEQEGAH